MVCIEIKKNKIFQQVVSPKYQRIPVMTSTNDYNLHIHREVNYIGRKKEDAYLAILILTYSTMYTIN